jgi:uncharacterized protein YqeY
MSLEERMREDLVTAQKAGEQMRVDTLRFLLAQVANRAIEKRGKGNAAPLTDDEVTDVLQKETKKRREAIEMFTKGGRADLAGKEEKELAVVQAYLPATMSEAEIEKIVGAIAKKGGDFKTVMKAAMAELKGKADGKLVSEAVKKALE